MTETDKQIEFLIPDCVRLGEPLSRHSTLCIGGWADYFAEPSSQEELELVLSWCSEAEMPYKVIGPGSNILFDDEGYRGCIISMLSFERHLFEVVEPNQVTVSASLRNHRFVKQCAEHGLGGMEFLAYIPGSIGGALAMNAGCKDFSTDEYHEVCDFLKEVSVYGDKGVQTLQKEELQFGYRESSLREYIILNAVFQLSKKPSQEVMEALEKNLKERTKRIPPGKNLGSMFKNPKDSELGAGALIEQAGLKGQVKGQVKISDLHANIFENLGSGSSKEVLELIEKVQAQVYKKFGVRLELEIEYCKPI